MTFLGFVMGFGYGYSGYVIMENFHILHYTKH